MPAPDQPARNDPKYRDAMKRYGTTLTLNERNVTVITDHSIPDPIQEGATMTTETMIRLARQHRDDGNVPSARACLADAVQQNDAGNDSAARMWALKSLAHSLGTLSDEYKRAAR